MHKLHLLQSYSWIKNILVKFKHKIHSMTTMYLKLWYLCWSIITQIVICCCGRLICISMHPESVAVHIQATWVCLPGVADMLRRVYAPGWLELHTNTPGDGWVSREPSSSPTLLCSVTCVDLLDSVLSIVPYLVNK